MAVIINEFEVILDTPVPAPSQGQPAPPPPTPTPLDMHDVNRYFAERRARLVAT